MAGEDEDIENLNFFFIDTEEYLQMSSSSKFQIVKARKGMGKSELLKKIAYDKKFEDIKLIVIEVKGSDLVTRIPYDDSANQQKKVNDWQRRICTQITLEIGKDIDFA